jgi:hypothetical protein
VRGDLDFEDANLIVLKSWMMGRFGGDFNF